MADVTLNLTEVEQVQMLIDGLGEVGRSLCRRISEAIDEIDDAEDPVSEMLTAALEDARARLAEVLP